MKPRPHIMKAFDDELATVASRLHDMGGDVETILAMALRSLENHDAGLAAETVALDRRLDGAESEIEAMATRIIALRAPVAADLRLVVTSLRMASTLERIGDLAKNIARRGSLAGDGESRRLLEPIYRIGERTQRQVSRTLAAWRDMDVKTARDVWRSDVDLDLLYNEYFTEVMEEMVRRPKLISLGSQLLFIAKNLERIGDHTTHISEMTHYVATGERLGDERPKGAPAWSGLAS